ncbi:dihydrofolate reductase family protein [Micromonospora sp. NPDC048999]|uniref:dihydrofolate reductase family protein n=1 Tax=Micromonospora sp. NPDC048999 TaxID=3155391 RepID=UPI0033F0E031
MGNVLLDVTMSLDGFMAGPDISAEHPMGRGGLALHEWIFQASADDVDGKLLRERTASTGAVVMGRRTFDLGIGLWQDTPWPAPCFVLTHAPLAPLVEKSGTFAFVTDPETAHREAVSAAEEKDVRLMGADISQQLLARGLVDELHIQIAPVLLGTGRRLFEHLGVDPVGLEPIAVIESPRVTHLHYRLPR